MLKKITIMAMALAAVAAFAAPSAMGSWKHNGSPIQQNAHLQLTGNAKFQAIGVGSIDCQVTSTAIFKAGQTTGTITQFEPDLDVQGSTVTQACKTGGFLSECQLHAVQETGIPWVIHTTTTAQGQGRVDVTHGEIHNELTGAFCPVTSATVTAGTVELIPNAQTDITSVQLSGNASVHEKLNDGQEITANTVVSGTNTILGTNAHTYDI